VEGDQAAGQTDLVHHLVAGIDAEAAADAFELQAVADIDAGGADGDALPAVDAMAPPLPVFVLPVLAARLSAPGLISDEQAVLVQERPLNPRPGAHIGADLLARPAGEKIRRRGE